MTELDRLRREALEALEALSSSVGTARAALEEVLERDPDISPAPAEYWMSDSGYADHHFVAMGRACQSLLYMVTGLYGRTRVAEMAGVDGDDVAPVQ